MTNRNLPSLIGYDRSFSSYLVEVNKIPSLSEEEEISHAKKFIDFGDLKSAHILVTSHLKLVAKIAMSFKGYGLPLIDLVSEGNLGLMQAVKKFDPSKGFRLSTYSTWWIKAAIQEYILRTWSIVKIGTTAAQKKLFYNLGKIKRRIQNTEARDFDSRDFANAAKELDVPVDSVAEMNIRMNHDYSMDDPLGHDSTDSLIDVMPINEANQEDLFSSRQEQAIKKNKLNFAMAQLNDRERHIIEERMLKDKPSTLDDLSKYYDISKERVRQIEKAAFDKLKISMLQA